MTQITVYTKNQCMPCRMTKMTLEKRGILFNEVNIDDFPERIAEVKALGFETVPVVCTPTEQFCHFRPDKLNAIAVGQQEEKV